MTMFDYGGYIESYDVACCLRIRVCSTPPMKLTWWFTTPKSPGNTS